MTQTTNQALTKRITTDVIIFTDKPTIEQIHHLKACGFRYDKGQWSRSETIGGVHDAAAVLTYKSLERA